MTFNYQPSKSSIKLPTILAVDPGSRELGIAVLRGQELLYYRVKTITRRKIPSSVLEIATLFIDRLIENFQPRYLAIEKMSIMQQNSALLAILVEQIKAIAEAENLIVREYSPAFVRNELCQSEKATKKDVAEVLAKRYPEFVRYSHRRKLWEREYYAKIFDSVALGVVCLDEIKQLEATDETTAKSRS